VTVSRVVLVTVTYNHGAGSVLNFNFTCELWKHRFATEGPTCLWEIAPGRGRKPTYGPERVKAVMNTTLQIEAKGSNALELPAHGPLRRE